MSAPRFRWQPLVGVSLVGTSLAGPAVAVHDARVPTDTPPDATDATDAGQTVAPVPPTPHAPQPEVDPAALAAAEALATRAGTVVDQSTTALCLTSVMSTQLGEVDGRAADVAARAVDIAARSREAVAATTEIRELMEGALDAARQLATYTREIEQVSAMLARLALESRFVGINAAIEAARAGAAGAGFSVVAEKVRELADGANDAADRIITRLGAIRDSATRSTTVMERVGGMVGAIDGHAHGIAGAAAEQEAGMSDVATGIGQLRGGVDEIVAALETMTEAGMSMGDDASRVAAAMGAAMGTGAGA